MDVPAQHNIGIGIPHRPAVALDNTLGHWSPTAGTVSVERIEAVPPRSLDCELEPDVTVVAAYEHIGFVGGVESVHQIVDKIVRIVFTTSGFMIPVSEHHVVVRIRGEPIHRCPCQRSQVIGFLMLWSYVQADIGTPGIETTFHTAVGIADISDDRVAFQRQVQMSLLHTPIALRIVPVTVGRHHPPLLPSRLHVGEFDGDYVEIRILCCTPRKLFCHKVRQNYHL